MSKSEASSSSADKSPGRSGRKPGGGRAAKSKNTQKLSRQERRELAGLEGRGGPVISVRFVLALLLVALGIAWIVFYYSQVRADPSVIPPPKPGDPKFMADLGKWNYLIGFALLMVGLGVSAHPSTPLGRGRGVVVGMLGCFILGLLWICTFYLFAENLTDIWVMNDLGQYNLVVGIAMMAVGFTFATRWE